MAKAPLSPLERVMADTPSFGLPDFQNNDTERQPATSSPTSLMPLFEQSAVKYNVPVNVLLALGEQESRFNPRALGTQTQWGRAKGLMQYLDSTAAGLGINPYDPEQAIDAAAKQIRERLDKGYSMEDAVKEHFAGPDRRQWGQKTARYGQEVLAKAERWGSQFQPSAPTAAPDQASAATELQRMLDEEEDGRYTVLSSEQVERFQRRAELMQGGDTLQAAKEAATTQSPITPLTIDNQKRVQQSVGGISMLPIDKQNSIKARERDREAKQLDTVNNPPVLKPWEPTLWDKIKGFGGPNKDAAFVEMTMREAAKRDGITIEEAYRRAGGSRAIFNPEGRPIIQALTEAAAVLGPQINDVAPAAANTALRAVRNGDVDMDSNWLDKAIDYTAIQDEDWKDPNYAAFQGVGESLGFSLVNMATSALASLAGTAATGPVGGAAVGLGTSGAISYRASKDQFLDRVRKNYQNLYGAPPSQEQWQKLSADADAAATRYGAFEAIPEAVSTMIFVRALSRPLAGASRAQRLGDALKRIGENQVSEQTTETITGVGQNRAELEAGLTKEELSAADVFRQQALNVALTSGVMGAGGMAGRAAYDATPYGKRQAAEIELRDEIEHNLEMVGFATSAEEVARRAFDPNESRATQAEKASTATTSTQTDTTPAAETPHPVEPAPVAQPEPQPAPQPAPSGPLGRALQSAMPGRSGESAADGQRVSLVTEGMEPITGSVISETPQGMTIRGDDGLSYEITADEISAGVVAVVPEGQAVQQEAAVPESVAPQPVDQPTTTSEAPQTVAEHPMAADTLTPYQRNQLRAVGITDAQLGAMTAEDGLIAISKIAEQAPVAKVEEAPVVERKPERAYDEMDEPELRDRLKYLGGQARASGGWNKMLMAERRKVEAAIEAKKASAVPVEEPEQQAATEVKAEQPADAVKWFGSREKADTYLAKKNLADSHEIVEAGRSRFEVRPKTQAAAEPSAATVATTQPAPAPSAEKPKTSGHVNRARKLIGAEVGETIVPSADVGYATSGTPYRIDSIDKAGTVHVTNTATGSSTTLSRADLERAGRQGVTYAKPQAIGEETAQAQQATAELVGATQAPTAVQSVAEAATEAPKQEQAPRRGEVGSKLASGEVVLTATGRETTPFPKIKVDTARKATNTIKAVDQWLMDNAAAEARARGDEFNLRGFEANREKPSQADKDSAEEYLFGDSQAPAIPSITKPLGSKPKAERPDTYGVSNKLVTADRAAELRKRLKAKLAQLNSGIDPEILALGTELAVFHVEAGVRKFADFARTMAADLDMPLSRIRPYLRSWYNGSRDMMEDAGVSIEGMDSPDTVRAELAKLTEESPNEPEQLDHPGQGALEGAPAEPVQGAASQEPAGQRPARSGGADARRDERTGSERADDARSLGDDQGAVPVPAGRGRGGRTGERSGKPVQRGDGGDTARSGGRRGGPTGADPSSVTPSNGAVAEQRPANFTITEADEIGHGGAKTKYRNNLAAIRTLKQLEAEGRFATADEQAALAKYVGWGGLPQAFERSDSSASKGWEKEVAELKELMTAEEYRAAASSSKNAHYTAPEIVRAMWGAVARLGFDGGRVLEPSVGAGNFFGMMPHELRKAAALNGVELDRVTSGIATHLYPEAKIARMGYQDYLIPDGYFDIAIGNPPFGRESLYDGKRKDLSGFSIHNYFFAKSLDGLRPGGVLAMVVTNRMLDVPGDKARRYMADRADFIGAIRLPNDAFMANAGTSVTTDIIFLQKRAEGAKPSGENWMEVRDYTDKDGNSVPLNEYFHRHPEMMLGDFGAYGSMYREGEPALITRDGQDTQAELASAIASLPQGIMTSASPAKQETKETVRAENVRVGSMFLDGDTVKVRGEDVLGENTAESVSFPNDKARERVIGMIGVRDAFARLRGLQLDPQATDKQLDAARKVLNQSYDAFVKEHGPINLDANKRLFRDDPTWPQLSALEDNFDKGLSAAMAKKTGEDVRKPSAEKAAIFSKRTQQPYQAPTSAASAKDALVTSLAETGRVDLDLMSALYGKPAASIVKELGDLVYRDPVKGYVTRDEYLSGNVKAKLAQARRAAQEDAEFARNVDALEAVQPADVEAVDINVKTGAPWVPADVMGEFANTIAEGSRARAVYNPASAKWAFLNIDASTAASQRFATGRVGLSAVLEAAANQKTLQVYDQHSDGTRTLNEGETQLANDKVNAVKEEWGRWVWADDARRERLGRIYNDTFNTNVSREYDGAHLTFPGKVSDDIISLRPHQANAVWRIVQSDTTLADHVVGAGKTFTMVSGAMELRRMGLAKKPMFVVPNHLVGQWAADFTKLYPGANVLATTKKDFEKDSRKRLFARIATGDWDAVIVAHTSFGKVEVEPKEQAAFIQEQVDDLDASIELMRQTDGKNSRNVKDTQKRRDALQEKLKKLIDADNKDDSLYWGELGVDALFVDEAHEFKNLAFSTSMSRVAGLGTQTGSQKAADLFLKVRQVLNATGGRNIVFATGTPISNTMAEMYTMQRYLDYANLKGQGISHFDAWARMFGEVVTDWELSPSGKYKMNSRFAKFVNMPELMQRYTSFADVVNRDDINRMLAAQGKKLPVPKVRGGKPENIVVERSPDQANYIGDPIKDADGNDTYEYPRGSLVWRSENLPKKAEKGADNMLKIMGDARKAALDMRLIDPSYPDYAGSKINVAADRMKALYDRWASQRGAQLVFIDLSTPKNARAAEAARLRDLVSRAEAGDETAAAELDKVSPDELMALDSDFSVYDDLKQKLIDRGVPADEIAFIHDAKTDLQKEELFGKVRSGRVRFLFGSTAKMGAGTNVQDRLVALHHMDAPWRPSDLEQREGRIIRQGNKLYEADPENFEVAINRYATKQTLDSRMWQTIEGKANFIEQVRKGTSGAREIEDVAGEAANAAEMKAAASGNPLILEEMSLRQKIRKLENERTNHEREQFRLRDSVRAAKRSIDTADSLLAELRADAKRSLPSEFVVTVDGVEYDKRKDAGEALLTKAAEMEENGTEEAEVGQYGDFTLRLERTGKERFVAQLVGDGTYEAEFTIGADPVGLSMRVTNAVKDLGGAIEQVEQRKARAQADIPKLEKQAADWGKEAELAQSKERHGQVLEQLKPKKKEAKPEEVKASIADQLQTALNDGSNVEAIVDGERFSVQPDGMYELIRSDAITLASPESIRNLPVADARTQVFNDLLANRDQAIQHPRLGAITFNRAGITKSRANSNDPAKVKTIPMLDRIIDGAPYIGRREADGVTYHYLGRRIRVDGEPVTTMITLRETPDGRITYYNHTMLNDVRTIMVEPDDPAVNDRYYRRPDLRYEAMSLSSPASPERIRSVLAEGPLGKQLQKMMDDGRLTVHADASTVPGASAPGMQAKTYDDGSVHLVASNLTPQNAQAVLLHEMFHAGARPLVGTRRWAQLLVRLEQLYKQFEKSNGGAKRFFDAARSRVETAQRYLPMSDVLAVEEFGAYAIEEYESAPAAVRRWVDDVIGAIKDYLFRTFGIQLGQVTPAQLRAMAIAAVRSETQAPGAASAGGERYSLASLPENAPSDAEVESWFSRKLTDAMAGPRSAGRWSLLANAPLDRMVEELVPQNKPAQEYLNLKDEMDAYRSKKHQQYDTIAQRWLKLNVANRKAARDMAEIMHEATIAQTDPSEAFKSSITKVDEQVMAHQPNSEAAQAAFAKKAADEQRRRAHAELSARFKALPAEFQSLYRDVRDTYRDMSNELDEILAANLGMALDIGGRAAERRYEKEIREIRDEGMTGEARKEAEAAALKKFNAATTKQKWNKRARMSELRQQLEANRLTGPYFPLARFGDLFVTVRDRETGEVISFSRFENSTDQQRFAKRAARLGDVQTGLLSNDSDVRGSVDPRFVTDVENILSGADVPDAVKDQVWQRYLESMPDMSMRKGFIHRKNRAGYSADALRAFASRMFHGAHQLGRLKYGAQMQEQLELSREVARTSENPERDTAVVNELTRRNDYVMNPQGTALAQHITSAAFVYQLSMSPAAALVNLSQTAIVGVPVIGAKYGIGNAAVELNRALGHFVSGRGWAERSSRLTDDERKAMRTAYDAGYLESTQSHNLAGVGETGVQYNPKLNKVMGIVAWQFHQAERLNREITFLAVYRLAREAGTSHEQAIDQARRMTRRIHFDYQASNRPRIMQGDTAKVLLVFRNFQINMLWRLFRDTHQAVTGDKAARREAIHQLAGITGMMALNAGVRGVWLYGLSMALASMFFGDDAEERFKAGTVELLGPTAAGFLLNGVPGHTLGISLSERVGMPDLWFRSPDRQMEGKESYNYWESQLLGAAPGIVQNMWLGWGQVVDGHVFRGVETMSPKFIKDLLRAARFANEGATTLRGDPLVSTFKPNEIVAQILGFTPAVLAEQYERNSALKNAEQRIMDERRGLIDRYASAYKLGDREEQAKIREEMKGFNRDNREVAITADSITRSIRSRQRYSQRTEGGVALNPRLDRRLRDTLGDAIYR
ncbi:Transglycosylase SLT domain protein [compost metagenome]